ncbi:hypothetical protein C8R44DRAFT_893441 [Mycena epipterygia]|nr:hypothetical protein C8R44DRAFT_893441 [Mycena epipterygia]
MLRSKVCNSNGRLVLVRGFRHKVLNRILSPNSQKEDDITLKKLERIQARLAKEEAAKLKAGTDHIHRPPKPQPTPSTPAGRPLDSHNLSLWDEVVNKNDQVKLAAFGIKSLEQLKSASQEAEADMNRPPYPSVERLKPRLRLAYKLYETIPQKLAFRGPKPSN